MPHHTDIRTAWIEAGYDRFAKAGPEGLKVERLAQIVGKSKSSFYHLFADLEIFSTFLLDYHRQQAGIMIGREAVCTRRDDFVQILTEHKTDLLFNRQLRIHREKPLFLKCFEEINRTSVPAILPLWKQITGIHDNSYLAELVLRFSLDNFFLQISEKTLQPDWLHQYLDSVSHLIRQFQQAYDNSPLDGSV